MTTVKCDLSECIHCEKGICQKNQIELDNETYGDWACQQYEDITDGADYDEEYYAVCKYNDDPKHIYKQLKFGKRIEFEEFVFYTRTDWRNKKSVLTESVSGAVSGTIGDLGDANKMGLVRAGRIEQFTKFKPVAEYPTEKELLEKLLENEYK